MDTVNTHVLILKDGIIILRVLHANLILDGYDLNVLVNLGA